ncbi:NERD domain-containing protein [Spongiactinospora rosea]|uniref:NERD domain-containing protein n=1 Tax=Spongiactinospora rosea TaxID=2248750 RepID=A0A366LUK2_9ACTN|nr:nuclease-related domain-containing protein [Spongiactinospora rosea]RBQ17611.1 NERD domain-containing protein [Spongiactinospora rosea]
MPGGSIYVPQDDKFTGASPQQMYEKFWVEGIGERRRMRAVKAAVGLAAGLALAARFSIPQPVLFGIAVAVIVAVADAVVAWYAHERTAVWRGKRKGEVLTGRILRRRLTKEGYKVLNGRAVRGEASIDHLLIGPGGVWIVDNEAFGPETELAQYGGRLFFGEKYGTKMADGLNQAAERLATVLTEKSGIPVTIEALLAVYGGSMPRGGIVSAERLTLLRPRRIPRFIRSRATGALSDEQVETLARTAARELHRIT